MIVRFVSNPTILISARPVSFLLFAARLAGPCQSALGLGMELSSIFEHFTQTSERHADLAALTTGYADLSLI